MAFSNRYFPQRRLHDLEALSAYAGHTRGHESPASPPRLTIVPRPPASAAPELDPEDAAAEYLLAAVAAVEPVPSPRPGPRRHI